MSLFLSAFLTDNEEESQGPTLDIQHEELNISVFPARGGVNVSGHCWVRSHHSV